MCVLLRALTLCSPRETFLEGGTFRAPVLLPLPGSPRMPARAGSAPASGAPVKASDPPQRAPGQLRSGASCRSRSDMPLEQPMLLSLGHLPVSSLGGFANSVTGPVTYPLGSIKVRECAFKDISSSVEPALGQAPLDVTT